jgi:hypothetical protein
VTAEEITDRLERIASAEDFSARSAELVEEWVLAGVGAEAVEPILRFMEEHPAIEFGVPGALVHFVERFYGNGYERMLVESVERKPTPSTVWMLNRVIGGTRGSDTKRFFISRLEQARVNPLADESTLALIDRFLGRAGG